MNNKEIENLLWRVDSLLTLLAFRHTVYLELIGEREEALNLSSEVRNLIKTLADSKELK